MSVNIQVRFAEFEIPDHLAGYLPFYNPAHCLPPPPCGCNCACNCPVPPPRPRQCGPNPVRYASGELVYVATDLDAHGFGAPWGHTRSFANQLSANINAGNGNNWLVKERSYLAFPDDNTVAVMSQATQALWFSQVGDNYVPNFAIKDTLILDADNNVFSLHDLHGGITQYSASSGGFQNYTDSAGNQVVVVSTLANGFNFTEVQRTFTENGIATTESFLYTWVDSSLNFPLLDSVTLRRKVGSTSIIRPTLITMQAMLSVMPMTCKRSSHRPGTVQAGMTRALPTTAITRPAGPVVLPPVHRHPVHRLRVPLRLRAVKRSTC